MKREAGCVFCEIIEGSSPSHRVYEDATTLVFMDLFPVAPGHTLLIPKEHSENLYEATPEAVADVIRVSHRVAHAIRKELAPDGLGVYQLNGRAAGQTVFHYHMHLIPRSVGDSLQVHSRIRGDERELEAMAERLAAALQG
jgi:histidine triad (HIT) family protein